MQYKDIYPGLYEIGRLMGDQADIDFEFTMRILLDEFEEVQLNWINQGYIENREFFQQYGGIPFPGDNAQFDDMVIDDFRINLLAQAAKILND